MAQKTPDFATVVRRRVQALMDERGYSQRDLAERLQCAQSTISQLLSGQRRRRDLDVWRNIAHLFDRPFAQLMAEAEALYGHLLNDAKRHKGEPRTDTKDTKNIDKSLLLSQHAIVKNAADGLLSRTPRVQGAGSPGAGDGKRFVLVVGGSAFDGHIAGDDDALLELLSKLDDPEADRIFERIAQRVYEKMLGASESGDGVRVSSSAPVAAADLHGSGPADPAAEHRSKHPRRDRPRRGDDQAVRTRHRA
jgi:transcriptional regulator with XRE-family HTH domain